MGVSAAFELNVWSGGERRVEWIDRARCLGVDPELFFPVGTAGPAVEQADRAKALCRECPVIRQCLSWALDSCQDAGVWGGLDEEERREIRRARRRAAAASRERELAAMAS